MKCMILSRDLMFSSQAKGAASQAGLHPQMIVSAEDCDAGGNSIVILDLSTPGLDIPEVVAELLTKNVRVIAIGPHVHEQKLTTAQNSGAHSVLTKGQAIRELVDVIQDAAAQ